MTIDMRTRVLILAFAAVGWGCDRSKADLEATRQELGQVTTERNEANLKLGNAETRISNLERQVTELRSRPACEAPPPRAARTKPATTSKGKVQRKAKARH